MSFDTDFLTGSGVPDPRITNELHVNRYRTTYLPLEGAGNENSVLVLPQTNNSPMSRLNVVTGATEWTFNPTSVDGFYRWANLYHYDTVNQRLYYLTFNISGTSDVLNLHYLNISDGTNTDVRIGVAQPSNLSADMTVRFNAAHFSSLERTSVDSGDFTFINGAEVFTFPEDTGPMTKAPLTVNSLAFPVDDSSASENSSAYRASDGTFLARVTSQSVDRAGASLQIYVKPTNEIATNGIFVDVSSLFRGSLTSQPLFPMIWGGRVLFITLLSSGVQVPIKVLGVYDRDVFEAWIKLKLREVGITV